MEQFEIVRNIGPIQIQEYQQNKYPCFFIDEIEEAVPGKSAKGFKNYSYNEWFFPAHFPDEPNVPGFIQVEMLTQVFLMTFLTLPGNKGKKTGFVSIKDARFKKKILPGMRVDVIATLDSYKRGLAVGKSIGFVEQEEACSANLTIAIPDILNKFIPQV